MLGRILGLVYLGIAIELWFVRSNSDLPARNALLLTAVDCSVVALLVQVQLAGLMNVLGWGLIAVYLGSGLGFLWCAMQVARNGAVRESLSLSKRFALF